MGKAILAGLGVLFVGLATLIQMVVDWEQSEAQGVPMPSTLKLLVLAAGALTLGSIAIGLYVSRRR